MLDADDQLRLIKDLVSEQNLDETLYPPEGFRAFIEAAKNDAHVPSRMASSADLFDARALQVFSRYQGKLLRLGAMDFGDLIVKVIELFRRSPELLTRYQRRFRYVFVDEYQDTNRAQYLIVSMLAGGYGNLCVVADDAAVDLRLARREPP